MAIIKIVITVLVLPLIWAFGFEFYHHVRGFQGEYGEFFLWGSFGFLMVFLFLHQFWGVYEFGQKIMTALFQFASPLTKFFSKAVPFYLTFVVLTFFAVRNFLGIDSYDYYFTFFAGFVFAMHILLTAQELQEEEKGFLKPDYLFLMSLGFMCTVSLTVLLFDLAFQEFSFPEFIQKVIANAWDNYSLVWKKI